MKIEHWVKTGAYPRWGHPTADGKTEAQRSCPRLQNHREPQQGPGSSPETLHWVLWTARDGRRRNPQRAWGGMLGPQESLVKLKVLALSPRWPKKKLMRLQGRSSRVRSLEALISLPASKPLELVCGGRHSGFPPSAPLLPAGGWVGGESADTSIHMPHLALPQSRRTPRYAQTEPT